MVYKIKFLSFSRRIIFYLCIWIISLSLTQIKPEIFYPLAFAKTSNSSSAYKKDEHRLENFILSTEGKDDWTRIMLAILNGVPAVERILKKDIRINIRGTKEFSGVTPLMFASAIGEKATVVVIRRDLI